MHARIAAVLCAAWLVGCGGQLVIDEATLGSCGDDPACLARFTEPCSPDRPFGRCDSGQVCDGKTCVVPSGSQCSSSVPHGYCAAGKVCAGGTCVTVDPGTICSTDHPDGVCPGASVCFGGHCVIATCDNGVIEESEDCDGSDLGGKSCAAAGEFTGGILLCNACRFDTRLCATCGNGSVEMGEDCDGSELQAHLCQDVGPYNSGSLSCTAGCTYDLSNCTKCGDGVRNADEECDGADLGGAACTDRPPASGGTLGCGGDCTLDFSNCTHCGDATRNGLEECEGADLGGETCVTLGFDTGVLSCSASCDYLLAGCSKCGNGAAEALERCDGGDLRGQTCASRLLLGGTLRCQPGCGAYDTSQCGIDHVEVRPAIDALAMSPGVSSTQQFEAWVVYRDGSDEKVDAQWYNGNAGAGSVSPAGLFTSNSALNANIVATVTAAWGGASGSRRFTIELSSTSTSCGNNVRESPEECDGTDTNGATCATQGFNSGTLGCKANCTFDTSTCSFTTCGNNTREGSEQCDGADLGGATCGSRGYSSGTLSCSPNCTFDEHLCARGPLDGLTAVDLSFTDEPPSVAQCGNGVCEDAETVAGCAADCHAAQCGNATCALDESPASCPADCTGTTRVLFGSGGAPTLDFDATGTFADTSTHDVTSLVTWTLADADGGAYDAALGVLNPVTGELVVGGKAGVIFVTAGADDTQTDCALQGEPTSGHDVCRTYRVEIVVQASFTATAEADIPLPRPIPANPASYFPTPCAPVAAQQPVIIYPHNGTLFPRNVYQVLFQWLIGGNGLFRARFDNAATDTHISIYTTADRWRPNADIWRLLTSTNAGGSVTFTVDAVPYTGGAPGTCYQTAKFSIDVKFSKADVPGAIYYWSTSIGGVKKASIASPVPINFIWDDGHLGAGTGSNYTLTPSDPEWTYAGTTVPWRVRDPNLTCVACHAVSRDGRQMALAYKGADELVNYDLSGQVAGVRGQIGYETQPGLGIGKRYWPTFNDTGDKLVVMNQGSGALELRAAQGGALLGSSGTGGGVTGLGIVPTGTGPTGVGSETNHPDWSPDGHWLGFAYNGAASRDGDKKGALAVLRYNKEAFPALPTSAQQPWGRAPWTAPIVLLDRSTGCVVSGSTCTGGVTGGFSNWSQPTFSPDGLWLAVTRTADGKAPKDEDTALAYALKWASCQTDPTTHACVPYPICASTAVTKCGPNGDQACAICAPVNLGVLNAKFSNCDNALSPASTCPSVPAFQNNMPRWAPTSSPDVYFLVFTSHRPYGKVSGEQQNAGTCKVAAPPASCFTAETKDQLWVAGFDSQNTSSDPSFPPFWLPFQLFAETNHRAYWSHDTSAGTSGCGAEICDGLDNDCDGLVDESCCAPSTEVCDGVDNDCDGIIDERDTVSGPVAGSICCTPSPEVCDCVDNNCDGVVDEGCQGCNCTGNQEVCDGVDDDCDGLVDEADPSLVYSPGGSAACPCFDIEVCDGFDNDCDGLVDDADPDAPLPAGHTCCFPFATDPCNGVDDDCDGVVDNGCCTPTDPPTEICDAIDNDCDGLIDEADPDLGIGACCPDADSDGYTTCANDCDDTSPLINPGIREVECGPLCSDGIDQNCDGLDCGCSG